MTETKFDKDQTVFVVWNNAIREGKIKSASLVGGWLGPAVEYSISGNFPSANHIAYVEREFLESRVYATRQEAFVALKMYRKGSIEGDIISVKGKICEVARRWLIGDCQSDRQRKILRVLKKWNSELNAMMKGPENE